MITCKLSFSTLAIAAVCFLSACNSNQTKSFNSDTNEIKAQRELEGKELIAKGEHLLTIGGCNDCHTPKIFDASGMHFDSSKMFAGHWAGSPLPAPDPKSFKPGQWMQMAPDVTAFVGPWGISYAANLTPDSATGIGTWSEEVFIKTFRTGKHLGMENGRPILPPMPWINLAKLPDEDLKAIYAYLRSLPPISNRVPGPKSPAELTAKQ